MANKKEFKTLEEAVAHIDEQDARLASLDSELVAEKAAHEITKQEKTDAESIAKDASEQADIVLKSSTKPLTVTVNKKKYKVLFGVDGVSKEDLAKDKELCEKLIKKGSGALEEVEG